MTTLADILVDARARLIALVDHAPPPLSPAGRALFDAECSTAWAATLARPL